MILRELKTATDKFVVDVKIVNEIYDSIQNVKLLYGSACDSYVIGLN